MRWEPPGEETVRRLAALGLGAPRGRNRVIGCYTLPFDDEWVLIEALLHRPWWQVRCEEWWFYTPRGWSEEWGVGRADFYFDPSGEELIGSYLDDPPHGPVTRIGLLLPGLDVHDLWPGRDGRIPEEKPMPERLLRLIWVE